MAKQSLTFTGFVKPFGVVFQSDRAAVESKNGKNNDCFGPA
jgi:hypothetical protein